MVYSQFEVIIRRRGSGLPDGNLIAVHLRIIRDGRVIENDSLLRQEDFESFYEVCLTRSLYEIEKELKASRKEIHHLMREVKKGAERVRKSGQVHPKETDPKRRRTGKRG